MKRDERQLIELLRSFASLKQSRLDQISRNEERLRKKLADLDRSARTEPMSSAALAGADLSYAAWSANVRKEINMELARTLADKEIARREAARAIGRQEVAIKLLGAKKP